MSEDCLALIFKRLFARHLIQDHLTVVWHVGEPLVLPISYYKNAFKVISDVTPPGIKIRHSFQSNGVLLNQAWCDFIIESGASIGLSIDGPRILHDAHRHTRKGKGTHEAAMRGARLLQCNNIRFHIIAVLTLQSLEYPDEILDFFIDNNFRDVCFNIEEHEGVHTSSSLERDDIQTLFHRFIERFFKLVKKSGWALSVREFDQLLMQLHKRSDQNIHNQQTQPMSIISVDWAGNVSTFSPELLGMTSPRHGNFVFGNVYQGEIQDLQFNPKFLAVKAEIDEGVDICRRTCVYFPLCGGGAPSNKLFENGTFASSETLYCRLTRKTIIDVILGEIEAELRNRDEGPRAHCTVLSRIAG